MEKIKYYHKGQFQKGNQNGIKFKKGNLIGYNTRFQKGHKINIGRPCSEETKIKIHKAKEGIATTRYWAGKKRSNHVRKRLSESKKGKTIEEIMGKETAEKWRNNQREKRLHQVFPQKDSSIERKVQKQLDEAGITYTKHLAISGQPDIFIEVPAHLKKFSKGIPIFLHGCAFHPCTIHKQRAFKSFSDEKERVYDQKIISQLFKEGYHPLVIWEHDINSPDFSIVDILNETIGDL